MNNRFRTTFFAFGAAFIGWFCILAHGQALESYPKLEGYWAKEGDDSVGLCFGEGGKLTTEAINIKEHEGFVASGMYRTNRDGVEILGFPGEGWLLQEHYAFCEFDAAPSDDRLLFKNCDLAGVWHRDPSQDHGLGCDEQPK